MCAFETCLDVLQESLAGLHRNAVHNVAAAIKSFRGVGGRSEVEWQRVLRQVLRVAMLCLDFVHSFLISPKQGHLVSIASCKGACATAKPREIICGLPSTVPIAVPKLPEPRTAIFRVLGRFETFFGASIFVLKAAPHCAAEATAVPEAFTVCCTTARTRAWDKTAMAVAVASFLINVC